MFQLAHAAADRVADLPAKNASITREPDEVLALGQPLGLGAKGLALLRVKTGHFTVNVSVGMPKKADRLVVTFAGARRDNKGSGDERRPFLARRKWMPAYRGAILALSDPQTEEAAAEPGARTGFYMGTFEHDLVPELLALVNQVCDELQVPRQRVVFYGAGTGGASAMLVGSRRKDTTGILAVNPLLRPEKYGDQLVAAASRAAGGSVADWERLRTTGPGRNNPLSAFRDGLADGHDLRLVVAQNLKDLSTVNRHFPGLWRRFEMNPEGGVASNGRVMILTYEGPETNRGEEPNEFTLPLIERAYAFFDGPIVPGAVHHAPPEGEGPGADASAMPDASGDDAAEETDDEAADAPLGPAARDAKTSARARKAAKAGAAGAAGAAGKAGTAGTAGKAGKADKAGKAAGGKKAGRKADRGTGTGRTETEQLDEDVADVSGD